MNNKLENSKEPDYSVIGKRVRKIRIENNMTQKELANKLDISVAYLSRIERGKCKINLKRLTQIAASLNVTTEFLISRK